MHSDKETDMTYTFDKNIAAERCISQHQQIIAKKVLEYVPAEHLAAIVLIGGYGRGEGGYTVDYSGTPSPFNDYDYFLVFKGLSRRRAQLMVAGIPCLDELVGIEVDFHPLLSEQLPTLRPSLMFAEMLAGHKIIYGDEDILSSMQSMPLNQLPIGEFTRLMTNRGCLLLLNYMSTNSDNFTLYTNKAALAVGDSILAIQAKYAISYREKSARLAEILGNNHIITKCYASAVEARFRPDLAVQADSSDLACITELWLKTMKYLEEYRLERPVSDWSYYCTPEVPKDQESGNFAKHLLLNLKDRNLRGTNNRFGWVLKHPRERIVSALPGLLSSRISPNHVTEQALCLETNTTWDKAANRLIELWGRYS
jgi:hypothetical protein